MTATASSKIVIAPVATDARVSLPQITSNARPKAK
jgi:hypothetical protein